MENETPAAMLALAKQYLEEAQKTVLDVFEVSSNGITGIMISAMNPLMEREITVRLRFKVNDTLFNLKCEVDYDYLAEIAREPATREAMKKLNYIIAPKFAAAITEHLLTTQEFANAIPHLLKPQQ